MRYCSRFTTTQACSGRQKSVWTDVHSCNNIVRHLHAPCRSKLMRSYRRTLRLPTMKSAITENNDIVCVLTDCAEMLWLFESTGRPMTSRCYGQRMRQRWVIGWNRSTHCWRRPGRRVYAVGRQSLISTRLQTSTSHTARHVVSHVTSLSVSLLCINLWRQLLTHGYSYKASCARPG